MTQYPKIIIDAGHGGYDPGASSNGIIEKDYALKISLHQAKRLKEHGLNVALTRNIDKYLSPNIRTSIVRNSGARICISNHVNSASNINANGAETIYSIHSNGELANLILDELANAGLNRRKAFTKQNSSGKDYHFMHRNTGAVETVIIEHGFASNADDAKKLKNNWQKYAEADVKAICKYIGVKYVSNTKNEGGSVKKQNIKLNILNNQTEIEGIFVNDRNFVSAYDLLTKLGYAVNWDEKNKVINVTFKLKG